MDRLESKVAGAFIGFAIGDALGQPVEFLKPNTRDLKTNPVKGYETSQRTRRGPGQWTDDTQYLMIGANAFITYGEIHPHVIMNEMAKLYRSKALRGIGHVTTGALQRFLNNEPPTKWGAHGANAQGAGPLPRVLPYALATKSVSRGAVKSIVECTHNDKEVFQVAGQMADYIHTLVRHGKEAADDFMKSKYSINVKKTEARSASPTALHMWNSAMYFFQQSPDDYQRAVLGAINFGVDTDTRGALTGALVGAHIGYEKLPGHLIYGLEANNLLLTTANHLYQRMEK